MARIVKRHARSRATAFCARLMLGVLVMAAGAAHADLSAREKWLAAVDPNSSTWSREALLHEVLGGTKLATRDQAIKLLGPPNNTTDLYYRGIGLADRIDKYRLSAANTETLRLDSDEDGRLKDPVIDGGGCACPLCRQVTQSEGAVFTSETVFRYLAGLKTAPAEPTLGSVESAVGHPGLHTGAESEMGRRAYWTTSVIWRFANDVHRFFIVSGRTLLRDRPSDAELPIGVFAIQTISDVCLAP